MTTAPEIAQALLRFDRVRALGILERAIRRYELCNFALPIQPPAPHRESGRGLRHQEDRWTRDQAGT